jgi:hypothetical protein
VRVCAWVLGIQVFSPGLGMRDKGKWLVVEVEVKLESSSYDRRNWNTSCLGEPRVGHLTFVRSDARGDNAKLIPGN